MSTMTKSSEQCCAIVFDRGGWRSYQCSRKAKIFRDGKGYCKQHDPKAAKERERKRDEEMDARWAEKKKKWKAQGLGKILLDAGFDTEEKVKNLVNKPSIAYLATPLSHKDPMVMEYRHKAVSRAAAKLIIEGYFVFSPVSHSHEIKNESNFPDGWEYWKEIDQAFILLCSKIIVLKLPGWEESIGVAAEMDFARKHEIPVEYLEESYISS